MDKIKVEGLIIHANHGVFASEKELGQRFEIDFEIGLNTAFAGLNDDLTKSVHYGELATFIKEEFTKKTYDLLETCVENLAIAILDEYELIKEVKLSVYKPWAPVGLPLKTVKVEIERKRNIAMIAIGSNIGDSNKYFDEALKKISALPGTKVLKEASRIITKPYGGVKQDDFLNSLVKIETYLPAENLLHYLLTIELELDRVREVKWGPRTIDLDIIYYNNEVINQENLIVPHPLMQEREFVLKPLCELAPYQIHPIFNKSNAILLQEMEENDTLN